MINTKSYCNRNNPDDIIRVATYGRVSTEHEAQINALQNQLQYYDKLLKEHPNWQLIEQYVDEGISGTLAKKRPAFLKMVEDAKQHKFDLLVTREVSRLCRNTKESLEYVDVLKEQGVEIFFSEDNIWSLDEKDKFKLGIMSLLAEQESEKIGERVRAGQMISRQNGIIYGNGNVLGYELVVGEKSSENTYVINEEQAETVRLIYHLYLHEGLGMKRIATRLIELNRKDSRGQVHWDVSKIARILDNRLYSGYIGYNKSVTIDPISHKRIKNTDKSTYEYIKGDFPAIISDDMWQQVQMLRSTKVLFDKETKRQMPVNLPEDPWKQILRCGCGKKFQRNRWRVNKKTGEACFGYQCRNVITNHKREFREKNGITDNDGYCNMASLPEWKLHFMLKMIFEKLWKYPGRTVSRLCKMIDKYYCEDTTAPSIDLSEETRLKSEKERIETRAKNLFDMRLDGTVDNETYVRTKAELDAQLSDIVNKLSEYGAEEQPEKEDAEVKKAKTEEIKGVLKECADLNKKCIDEDVILCFVDRVTAHENRTFEWYINLNTADTPFEENDYVPYLEFKLTFDEAKAYRKSFGNYLRKNQWEDITVKIFICV